MTPLKRLSKNSNDSDPKPKYWIEGYLRLFISHSSSDKLIAQNIKDTLEIYAISGFVAHSDIEPTKEWQKEIELALNTCDSALALLSPKFHKSKWTDQEIGIALGRDKLIIPIRMDQDPYGFIGKFQAITLHNENQSSEEIFDILLKNKKTKKTMAYALINMFEDSDSFAAAKRNIGLVKRIEYWNKELIQRLEKSENNNSQIKNSFGVPGSINFLIRKLKE